MEAGRPSHDPVADALLTKRQEEWHILVQECQDCRKDIEPHWQFCAHCGIRLETHCPGCGNALPPLGAHSCPACGLALPHQGNPT